MPAYKEIILTANNGVDYKAEYYPHKRIVLRTAGFKIVVAKAYGLYDGGNCWVYTAPTVQMSTNTTVFTDLNRINRMQDLIKSAIMHLNNEGDGLIIPYDFNVMDANGDIPKCWSEDIPTRILALHASATVVGRKSIPYKEVTHSKVYKDDKDHYWVYLGHGILEHSDSSLSYERAPHRENRHGCYEVYLKFDDVERYKIDTAGNLLISGYPSSCMLDTYASRKRFMSVEQDLNWNGRVVKFVRKDRDNNSDLIDTFTFSPAISAKSNSTRRISI